MSSGSGRAFADFNTRRNEQYEYAAIPRLQYPWNRYLGGALAYLGFRLGENYKVVDKYMGPVTYVVLGVIAAAFIWRVVKQKRAQKT
jgi:hypothetical protein